MTVYAHHPDRSFTGTARLGRARLDFDKGVATLGEDAPLASLRRNGYTVATTKKRPSDATDAPHVEVAAETAVAGGDDV